MGGLMAVIKRGDRWGARTYDPDQGRQVWLGTFPTRKAAKEAEAKAQVEASKHAWGRSDWTVAQFAERWLNVFHGPGTRRPEDTTLTLNRGAIGVFVEQFGSRKLRAVTPQEARDFAGEFRWRGRIVKAMFADAVKDGRIDHSPFHTVTFTEGPGRQDITPLTLDEVNRLAELAEQHLGFYGPHFATLILTAAWTGMRPGELGGLEWRDIDWDARLIRVRRQSRNDRVVEYTKTKARRSVPMSDEVYDRLRRLPRTDEFVFHTTLGRRLRPNNLRYAWKAVRAAFLADLPRDHWLVDRVRLNPKDQLDPYELRHMAGSMLADQGLTARDISAVLGNSEEVCARTYIHDYVDRQHDRVREAMRRAGSQAGSTTERESA